jgi:hypothetical protein
LAGSGKRACRAARLSYFPQLWSRYKPRYQFSQWFLEALGQRRYIVSDDADVPKRSGTFSVSSGQAIYGELTLAGGNTSLYLRDNEPFNIYTIPDQCILGTLYDLKKVSLIDCHSAGPGTAGIGDEYYHFVNVFPHYVLTGRRHIKPTEKIITTIGFVIDDANILFNDFDSFGFVTDAPRFIENLVRKNSRAIGREIPTGPNPVILYFTGKNEIFTAETNVGRISATHGPSFNTGGPSGVRLDNKIFVSIHFKEPLTFGDAMVSTSAPLQYFAILVGRLQHLSNFSIRAEAPDEPPCVLEVYWSLAPRREPPNESEKPHSADILVDAVNNPEEFARTLASWLDRHKAWEDARLRFATSFARQREYNIDRLISAANMFDILPSSAVPSTVCLSREITKAKVACRKIFKALPKTLLERQSVLDALGRLGKANLKQKIRHRAGIIQEVIGDRFPELSWVTDEAVNCRNHYVHGGKSSFNYNRKFSAVVFLTKTLEFVFVASDLIEAGWDAKAWNERPTVGSHYLSRYRIDYAAELQALKALKWPKGLRSTSGAPPT